MMKFNCNYYAATAWQLFVVFLSLWLTRFLFYFYNIGEVGSVSASHLFSLSLAGIPFDLNALAYFNAIFVLMRFLPFDFVTRKGYLKATDIIFCVTNAIMLLLSLGDIPFFPFSGGRLRWSGITQMLQDPNIVTIIFSYAGQYWWAFIGGSFYIALTLFAAMLVRPNGNIIHLSTCVKTKLARWLLLVVVSVAVFLVMRGRLGPGRPLSIGDATWHVDRNPEINIVLNTPFCVIRSIGKLNELPEMRFFSDEKAARLHPSVHASLPDSNPLFGALKGKNVVIITIESGGQLWLDSLVRVREKGRQEGLMPFLDSISAHSLCVRDVMGTGRRTVEGMTAVYGGFPAFEPMNYMVTPYAKNNVDAAAELLHRDFGYSTRFYFGGNPGSYGMDQLVKAMGFREVLDSEDFPDDSQFDGAWGIFDHAMGLFAARDMSSLPQPFITGWLTISNHGPYITPADWDESSFRNPPRSMYRSVEYTDRSLRMFFDEARKQPWFDNTLFIITSDHGCRDLKDTCYDTPYLYNHILFMAYTPDGSLKPDIISDRVMSQFDINATILRLLGYDKEFVSMGRDIFDNGETHYGLSFASNQYIVTGNELLIKMSPDMKRIDEVFDINADPTMKSPVTDYDRAEADRMADWTRAMMQEYTVRMRSGKMSAL